MLLNDGVGKSFIQTAELDESIVYDLFVGRATDVDYDSFGRCSSIEMLSV